MQARQCSALFLVAVMALAGCLGATEPAPEIEEPVTDTYELKTTWIAAPGEIQLGEVASFTLGVQQTGIGEWRMDYDVLQPDFTPVDAVQWTENDVGFVLVFTPSVVGEHIVSISIVNTGASTMDPQLQPLVLPLMVSAPEEAAPIITVPARLVLEEPNVVWFEGRVDHRYLESCTVLHHL